MRLNLTASKTIRILTKIYCTSDPHMVILARMGDELQAQNGANFDF